ncbi:hypothetical protein C1645_862003 [Glomus cerebriforme]|uniref:MIR domain-containing protein n=1 Tax=Glomus cerebriforme TaxID=658196 RepID=A0A397TDI9_9GLOM|nr:hypothetical protein C1645_862003 [Glomus cerebriforme]
MELPKYTGTIHPEEWLKQVKVYCYLKDIENEQKILKICKLMIDSTIIIPNEINSFDELIKTLKSHMSFNIFKDSCKRKLKLVEYIPEKEEKYTATFLANFRSICKDAEINDPKKIKKILYNSYSSDEFEDEFIRRVDGIESIDEIFKAFSDAVFGESKIIKYNSLITLKHVATGKYLTSSNINYQTGSGHQVVFAASKTYAKNADALWSLNLYKRHGSQKKRCYDNVLLYGDRISLTHKKTGKELYLNESHHGNKSPTTEHTEVCCRSDGYYSNFEFIKTSPTNNKPYVRAKDIVNLKGDCILHSHDFTFTIDNKTFQEVVSHQKSIDGNDEWRIDIK